MADASVSTNSVTVEDNNDSTTEKNFNTVALLIFLGLSVGIMILALVASGS